MTGSADICQVVHWEHPKGAAHCLGRAYFSGPGGRPIAVLSEIRTNPDMRGLASDFANAAGSFLAALKELSSASPDQITWLAQHGAFSYNENVGGESFTHVDLEWDGQAYHGSHSRHHLLSTTETSRLLSGLTSEPVPEALRELGWQL